MKFYLFILYSLFAIFAIATDVYIGTYTDSIYKYKLNKNGYLELDLVINMIGMNPSWFTIDSSDKDNLYLYAVNEVDDYNGQYSGSITSLCINDNGKNITFLNR